MTSRLKRYDAFRPATEFMPEYFLGTIFARDQKSAERKALDRRICLSLNDIKIVEHKEWGA